MDSLPFSRFISATGWRKRVFKDQQSFISNLLNTCLDIHSYLWWATVPSHIKFSSISVTNHDQRYNLSHQNHVDLAIQLLKVVFFSLKQQSKEWCKTGKHMIQFLGQCIMLLLVTFIEGEDTKTVPPELILHFLNTDGWANTMSPLAALGIFTSRMVKYEKQIHLKICIYMLISNGKITLTICISYSRKAPQQ